MDTYEKDDWSGALIKVKPEWMNPGERDVPYLVIEDRGDRVLVQELRQYAKNYFLGTWCWSKDWCYIIDPDFINPDEIK